MILNNPAYRKNLIRILSFSLLWLGGGIIFTLVERGVLGETIIYPSTGEPYEFMNNLLFIPLATFFGGGILASLDILVINRLVKNKAFITKLILKGASFLVIILLTTILAGMFANSATQQKGLLHKDVINGVFSFINNFAFWSIIIYAGFLTILYLLIIEVSDNLGASAYWNFFTGRYHQSKIESRIFMFLDLKGSTTLAEKLGHVAYFEFLNQFFSDISQPVLMSWGIIYQYVGDEMVIYWNADKGAECIDCFFAIKEKIEEEQLNYLDRFNVIPEFRAGIHGGRVSIGEIGTLKKDILFIGDVLNATSRIQGLCKELKVDLLVSEDVVRGIFPWLEQAYSVRDMGYSELRGKEKPIHLYHLSQS